MKQFFLIGEDIQDFKLLMNVGFDEKNNCFKSIKNKISNLKKESISEETYMELNRDEESYIKNSLDSMFHNKDIISILKNKHLVYFPESIIENFLLEF